MPSLIFVRFLISYEMNQQCLAGNGQVCSSKNIRAFSVYVGRLFEFWNIRAMDILRVPKAPDVKRGDVIQYPPGALPSNVFQGDGRRNKLLMTLMMISHTFGLSPTQARLFLFEKSVEMGSIFLRMSSMPLSFLLDEITIPLIPVTMRKIIQIGG